MVNIETIWPKPGVVPDRPTSLKPPDIPPGSEVISSDDLIIQLLDEGKTLAIGGLSLLGERLATVFLVSLLGVRNRGLLRKKSLYGWYLAIGHPDLQPPDFVFMDTSKLPLSILPFPNCMTYFLGEVDPMLLEQTAPPEELQAIARFILPFISDEGPPESIDW